jgi:hypothetical protein
MRVQARLKLLLQLIVRHRQALPAASDRYLFIKRSDPLVNYAQSLNSGEEALKLSVAGHKQ